MCAKVLRDPLVQYYQGLNWYGNIDELAALVRGGAVTPSKLFANHNALGQLTNHNTFRFSEGGPSSNLERIEPFVPGWGERYCNNVNYVKSKGGGGQLFYYQHSSKYIIVCAAEERHWYRFGTTWGWVNDNRIYIFGWTFPLMSIRQKSTIKVIHMTLTLHFVFWSQMIS